jgi:hypothetical protein
MYTREKLQGNLEFRNFKPFLINSCLKSNYIAKNVVAKIVKFIDKFLPEPFDQLKSLINILQFSENDDYGTLHSIFGFEYQFILSGIIAIIKQNHKLI